MTSQASCYGRDDLIGRMLERADDSRCVLLFGGRQAGKTTILRHAERNSTKKFHRASRYSVGTVAVYVDLMALPYDSGPPEFYSYLMHCATSVCAEMFADVSRVTQARRGESVTIRTVDAFCKHLGTLFDARRRVRRVIFLLDEAGRVLGKRFPRAFQDNLFSMLYVDPSDDAKRVSFVFSGAQELAGFCEDETSPLGSRAEQVNVTNLGFSAFSELVLERVSTVDEEVRRRLFSETGGHAGLGARLAEQCSKRNEITRGTLQEVTKEAEGRARRLFEHWLGHFSDDAKIALQGLSGQRAGVGRREIAQLLAAEGRDRFRAERTWHELQYVGVCRANEKGRLAKCNDWFWRYYAEFDATGSDGTGDERRVWERIKEAEITVRGLVHRKYRERWPGREFKMMAKLLGAEWAKIESVRSKAKSAYPLSPGYDRPLMDCMYLGQLGTLIEHNQAWSAFKDLLGDKREFQRMLKDIYPVRNDIAHFVTVPRKELSRCEIACDDVLVILKQAVGEDQDL